MRTFVKRSRRLIALTALGSSVIAVGSPHVQARASVHLPAPTALDVQPFPGTPDASPQTEVGFPALTPSQIESLRVIGSRSGWHGGRLSTLPGGQGAAFAPRRPFADGERVSVQAELISPAAGTASGAPGATRIRFSFTVATPVRPRDRGTASWSPAIARPAHAAKPLTHSFHSESWLHAPIVGVTGTDPDPGLGDIIGDVENSLQEGPLILSPQGQLIYFQPVHHAVVFNVEVQNYQGQTVLTYWKGWGVSVGHGVILDHNYQQVATVRAGHGYYADAHEFQITPQGDALISVYVPVRADLSSIGGSRHGVLIDSIIQEIDIATGQVIWEWHASGHVPLDSTYAGKPGRWPFDFFHINSIQELPGDRLLVSGRNTWSLYEIDIKTGRVILVIGGKHSSFRMGPGTNFEWQHHARMQPDGTITVFDNATDLQVTNERESRALRIRLNLKRRRATLVRAYTNNPPVLAGSQGSVQPLSDGNTFVGWGAAPYFSEFAPGGRQLFSLHFNSPLASYRGLRVRWWGQPLTPPSVAATATARGTTVYASWNGATMVAGWRVLAGPSPSALAPVGQFHKTSFETTMPVSSTEPYFAVQALDSNGNVLGSSTTVGADGRALVR